MQSGKPVGVFETHPDAPRVLIANSNLVARLGDLGALPRARRRRADDVRADDRGVLDLHRDPGDPPGHLRDVRGGRRASASAARWRGRLVVTAGLGGMGGAQPLAVTMNEGCALCVEVDLQRIERRIETALPRRARRLARRRAGAARGRSRARAARCRSACSATPPRCCPSSCGAASHVDVVTDQTSAHDPLNGYVPGRADGRAGRRAARARTRTTTCAASARARSRTWPRSARCSRPAPRRSTTATRCAAWPPSTATRDAFAYPGFVPAYIRPLFCEGKGPFRWVALSGDPADIAATDDAILDLFGDQEHIRRWIELARERVALPGAAGAHLLARLRRAPPRRAALQRDGGRRASCAGRS